MRAAKGCAAMAGLALASFLLSGCARGVVSYEGYDYATASGGEWDYSSSSSCSIVREEESSGPGLLDLFFAALLSSCHDDDPDVVVIHDTGGRHGGGRPHLRRKR